jgi:hypothetical protein
MKKRTLSLALGLCAILFTGALHADFKLCRKTAEQVQCELAADLARDQCIADANGDPDALWLCELDWMEAQQVCDAIPPECDIYIP